MRSFLSFLVWKIKNSFIANSECWLVGVCLLFIYFSQHLNKNTNFFLPFIRFGFFRLNSDWDSFVLGDSSWFWLAVLLYLSSHHSKGVLCTCAIFSNKERYDIFIIYSKTWTLNIREYNRNSAIFWWSLPECQWPKKLFFLHSS